MLFFSPLSLTMRNSEKQIHCYLVLNMHGQFLIPHPLILQQCNSTVCKWVTPEFTLACARSESGSWNSRVASNSISVASTLYQLCLFLFEIRNVSKSHFEACKNLPITEHTGPVLAQLLGTGPLSWISLPESIHVFLQLT